MSEKNMDVLTKEQQEYIRLKSANKSMVSLYKRLLKEGKITTCFNKQLTQGGYDRILFTHERYFYLMMEVLQGKQPELLEQIAEFHKNKDKPKGICVVESEPFVEP